MEVHDLNSGSVAKVRLDSDNVRAGFKDEKRADRIYGYVMNQQTKLSFGQSLPNIESMRENLKYERNVMHIEGCMYNKI